MYILFLNAESKLFLMSFTQLVRPVTMVPSVPGIPGPSSPQPVQSEAKMVSKDCFLFLVLSLSLSPSPLRPAFSSHGLNYTMEELEILEKERFP